MEQPPRDVQPAAAAATPAASLVKVPTPEGPLKEVVTEAVAAPSAVDAESA